jgi:hypothetical protein
MYFLSPDATLNAAQRADILSSIFSPFMFWVVPTCVCRKLRFGNIGDEGRPELAVMQ